MSHYPGRIIQPEEDTEVHGPLVFLAGPVKAAPRWHYRAIGYLWAMMPTLTIASPTTIHGLPNSKWGKRLDQISWETKFLNRAAEDGVILFWLAEQDDMKSRRSYGRTTRYELGEWKERRRRGECNLVIGIEEHFEGRHYLQQRLLQEQPDLHIHRSLRKTCVEAISIIRDAEDAFPHHKNRRHA